MSIVATKLQNWRIASPDFDKNAERAGEHGALDLFVEQTKQRGGIISEDLKNRAFASMGNTVQVPVLNYNTAIQIANQRSCVISDAENTSALYTVVWSTYFAGFTMVPSLYMNNEIGYNEDFAHKMKAVIRAFGDSLDTAAVAALEAAKTQVYADSLQYTVTGNSIQVPMQMATEILGDLNPMMRANKFNETIHIVGNAGVDSLVRKLAQHDIYNAVNKRNEYAGKIFHFTPNITNESNVNGTLYAVADGNVGLLTRVDREALRRARSHSHEWDVVFMPELGIQMGTHYYTAVGDQSEIAGAASADITCGVKEYFGFSVDAAFIVAYNEDPTTYANPIMKAEIASPGTDTPIANPVYVVNAADFQGE